MNSLAKRGLTVGAALLLGAGVLFQLNLVFRNYMLEWGRATYRTVGLPSMHRSARFLLGEAGADYLSFLDSVVPDDMPIVKPEHVGTIGSQSIMQYFLMPRGIPACPCELGLGEPGGACGVCLAKPGHSVPSIDGFDPEPLVGNAKRFVPFPQASDWARGVFVPPEFEVGQVKDIQGSNLSTWLVSAMLDSTALIGVFAVGVVLGRLALGRNQLFWSIAVAFPLGAGLVTWLVFVSSWLLRFRVTVLSYVGASALLLGIARLLLIRGRQSGLTSLDLPNLRQFKSAVRKLDPFQIFIWAGIIGVLLVSVVIGLGRAYSTFDGIVNWAIKGYAIAEEGTVFAGARWGGHALEYPQNLHLQIAFFKLLDDDYLPGSKLLFSSYFASLILGCIACWRSAGVHRYLAGLGGLMIATTPLLFVHSTLGFGNLPMSVYLVLGLLMTLDGVRNDMPARQLLGSMLLGLAGWTRLEAAPYALIGATAVFAVTKLARYGKPRLIPLIGPAAWVLLPWAIFYLVYGRQTGGAFLTAEVVAQPSSLLGHTGAETVKLIFEHLRIQLRDVSRWGAIIPIAAIGASLGAFRSLRGRRRDFVAILGAAAMVLVLILGVFFLIGTSGRHELVGWLNDSFDRHLIPVFAFLVVLAVHGLGSGTGQGRRILSAETADD